MATSGIGKQTKVCSGRKATCKAESLQNSLVSNNSIASDSAAFRKTPALKRAADAACLPDTQGKSSCGSTDFAGDCSTTPVNACTPLEFTSKPGEQKKLARKKKIEEERKINDIMFCFLSRAETASLPLHVTSICASASSSRSKADSSECSLSLPSQTT